MFAWFKWIYKKNSNVNTQQNQQVLPSNVLSNLGTKCTKCVTPPTQGNLKNKLPTGKLPQNNSLQASKMIPVNNKCSTGNCNFKQNIQNNQRTPQFSNQFVSTPSVPSAQFISTPQSNNFNIVSTQRLNNQNTITDSITMSTVQSIPNNTNKNSSINLDEIYNLNFGNNMDNNNDNENEWDDTENEDNNNDSILNDSDSEVNDQDDDYDNDSDCSGDDDDSDVIFQNYF